MKDHDAVCLIRRVRGSNDAMQWRLPLICFIVWLRAIPARELPILHRDADDQYIDGDRIVQSGSTFSLNCSSDQPVEWHLPVYAKALSRHGERLGRRRKTLTDNNTSVLTVTDSFYMDTGSYTCRQVATNQSVTQYVYVADDNNLVTLDEEEPSFVAIAGQSISVPCKPTHPSVKVHMKYENGTIIKSGWTFDPHLGFSNTPVRPNAEHILECCGNLGDEKRPEHCAAITFGVKRDTLRAPKPFIEPSAATVHVTVAESVAINCSAWSEMGVQFQISWVLPDGQSKDIKVLKQSRGVKRSDGESEFMESYRLLKVSGVRLEHSGTYQCVTRDYTGKTDSASFRLQVHEVGESFLKVAAEERQHIQLFPGETFTWTLGIEAHPPANLTWFGPDGIVRSNGEKLETRRGLDHVSLLIGNVQVSDSGRYRLAVSNSARIEWRTIHLVVLAEPESRWLRSADREASDFYKPGQHFTFVCQSRGIYGNVTVGFLRCQSDANCAAPVHPVAIYRSLRGNLTRVSTNRTTNDETVRMNVTNELSVLQLTLGGTTRSSGRYTCQACNPYGCSSVLTSQAQIIVSEFSGGFELWKNRNAVVEGDDVQLRCGVTRYNFVDRLRWSWHSADPRRDPSPTGLPPGVQLSQESSDVSHVEVLTLSSVATSANGTYTCRATSVDGNVAQKVISLAVQTAVQPEIWAISDPEQAMEPGNSTKLVCQFDGKPVPSIHWEKDGQPISGGYVTGSNQFVYEINFAKPEHSGIYKCVCKNKMGGSEQSFRVHVSSSLPLGILAAIVTVIFIAVALLIVLVIKVRNDQKRKALFRTEQMRNFDKGNPDSINPDLPVDEQAELLPYDRKWEFPRNRLNLGKQLGAGAFGRVLKAEASGIVENEPVTTVAVKMVRSQGNELALKALMSELKIMIHMGSHLNVVNLLGACTQNVTRGELLVIVEYCRFGNIQKHLIRNRTSFIDQINPLTGKLFPDLHYHPAPVPQTPASSMETSTAPVPSNEEDLSSRTICTGDLFCWAFQIARGMDYLATNKMRNFDKGNPDSINPDLPVDEQAELLPYDRKWEFPRNRLNLGKQLGAGAFGRVLKAEASGIVENEPVTTVAVKMVRSQGNELALKALMSELKIMIHMGSHLNVVNLLGACTQNVTRGELLVIVEYCRFGNIQNFLIRNRTSFIDQINPLTGKLLPDSSQSHGGRRPSHGPDGADVRWDNEPTTPTTPTTPTSPVLTGGSALSDEPDGGNSVTVSGSSAHWRTNYRGDYRDQPTRSICTHDLLCWAFQIARGMAYLAKKKILHGDLAARNILLADDNVVKVADFGLAREVYRSGNYKKKGQGPLPVKWMAVESIMDRVFSTQSDVWAFGIVLWELFSLGKTPYPGLEPDEQFFQRLQEGYRMSKPRYATDDVYRVMTQCWQLEPSQRPDFNRLEDSMAAHLDESVRRHYLQLDQPHQQVNNQLTDNYLPMIKSPDYVNAGRQQPGPYVNVSCSLKLERLSSNTSDYLSMSDQGSAKRPTSSSFPEADYLLMTPSPTSDSVTDFPFPAVAQRLPPVADQVGPVLTPDEQTAVDGGLTAFSNPNYRLDHTGLDVNDCVVIV